MTMLPVPLGRRAAQLLEPGGTALGATAELARHLLGRPLPVGPQEGVVVTRVRLVRG